MTRQITWNELSEHADELLLWIKQGNHLEIYQEGQAIAELIPHQTTVEAAWKHHFEPLELSGVNMGDEIIKDRNDARV